LKQLILGGVRSGKSLLAEKLALDSKMAVTYIATATVGDAEMQARVEQHQQRRPESWKLIEEPLSLADAMVLAAADDRCLLIDCLTLWLTNLLLTEDHTQLTKEREKLLHILPTLPGLIILVSNETGLGVVPMGELSRRFTDEAGWLHQSLAQTCDRVILTVAGLPQILKETLNKSD
jgi:adenosylcobinamide kinase/adenosylcobinamide-phosphate guanylyltransferase